MPGGERELVHRDDRAGVDLDDVGVDVELLQRLLEHRRPCSRTNALLALGVAVLGVGEHVPAGSWYSPSSFGGGGAVRFAASQAARRTTMSFRGRGFASTARRCDHGSAAASAAADVAVSISSAERRLDVATSTTSS